MRKSLLIIVLSIYMNGLAQAQVQQQNSFSFSIAGPNGWISVNNYPQLIYPVGIYYPQQIIVPAIPYARQPILVPVTFCDQNISLIRDQFGNISTYRNCWTQMIWQ